MALDRRRSNTKSPARDGAGFPQRMCRLVGAAQLSAYTEDAAQVMRQFDCAYQLARS